jgi:hypothetical protein
MNTKIVCSYSTEISFQKEPMHMKANLYKAIVLSFVALALQACGGGGGESLSASNFATPNTTSVASTTPDDPGNKVTYESVTNNNFTAALGYKNIVAKPMRKVIVSAVVGDAEVARTVTSDTGAYTLNVPKNASVSIQAFAKMRAITGAAKWNVAVYDNTDDGALWSIRSSAASSGTANSTRNVKASLGWNGSNAYIEAERLSAPFAILDTIYTSMQLVISVQPEIDFPKLKVYWSPKNNPSDGDVTIGDIGSSYFDQITNGKGVVKSREIFILGKENVDTDEFDSGVVAHEYGHYLQSAFSRSHSTGGPHSLGDKLDMTLSYGEGWGYAFASAARNSPVNPDSSGLAQSTGFIIPTGTAPTTNKGWFSESSVQYVIYNLFTTQGFAPIWAAFSGPMRRGQDALNTIFSFAAAVRSAGDAKVSTALNSLLTSQNIFAGRFADQWGSGETNDGGRANNLPVHKTLSTTAQPVCFNRAPDGTDNKLGGNRYFRFTVPAAGVKTITAAFNAADGHDIDFEVYQNGTLIDRATSESTTSEVISSNVAAGEIVVRVFDYNINTASTSAADCATIRIN